MKLPMTSGVDIQKDVHARTHTHVRTHIHAHTHFLDRSNFKKPLVNDFLVTWKFAIQHP